jgi:acylphosphatase
VTKKPCEMHAVVQGRVQGVGFRATARDYAEELNLCGTVRNCPDGSVEIYAQGEEEILGRYLELLKQIHRIESIDVRYFPLIRPYEGFRIIHSSTL